MKKLKKNRSTWLAVAGLVLLASLFFWQIVFGGRVLYWGTPLLLFHPWRSLATETLVSWQIPLWNPYVGSGTPFVANLQSAVFYPLNALFLVMPVERAIGYSAALHVALAGVFTLLYLRLLKLPLFAAILGALAYMLSGYVIGRVQFLSMVSAIAWLPLLFYLVERLVRPGEGRAQRSILCLSLGVVVSLQLLSGHVQIWYYSLWFSGLYAIFRVGQISIEKQRREGRLSASRYLAPSLAYLAAGLALGLALSAVQLLPTWELAGSSTRANRIAEIIAMSNPLWPWHLVSLALPDFFGNPASGNYWAPGNYWDNTAYLGLLPLLMAVLALLAWAARWRRRIASAKTSSGPAQNVAVPPSLGTLSSVPFFWATIIVSIILALGDNLPIYPAFFRLMPGFGYFQGPARLLFLYTFSVAVLGAVGAAQLCSLTRVESKERIAFVSRLMAAGGLLLFVFTYAGSRVLGSSLTFIASTLRFGVILLALSLLLLIGMGSIPSARFALPLRHRINAGSWLWQGAVLALLLADLVSFSARLNPTTEPALYASPTKVEAWLRQDHSLFRIFTPQNEFLYTFFNQFRFKDYGSNDLGHLLSVRETMIPNLSIPSHLYEAQDYNPLEVGDYRGWLQAVERQDPSQIMTDPKDRPVVFDARLLGMANVKYILSSRPISNPDLTLKYDGEIKVYENSRVLPRAWLVTQREIIPDREALLARSFQPSFDPAETVLLEKDPGVEPETNPASSPEKRSSAEILRYDREQITIRATTDQPAFLVIGDTYYPGWEAEVDGRPQAIWRADYTFRAIALLPGDHNVVLQYRPFWFQFGALVSAVASLIVFLIALAAAGRHWLVLGRPPRKKK